MGPAQPEAAFARIDVVALAVAVYASSLAASVVGGLVIGAGVAAMHYMGMWALQVPGVIVWSYYDPAFAVYSVRGQRLIDPILRGRLAPGRRRHARRGRRWRARRWPSVASEPRWD